jgi:hypothetical protein
MFCFRFWFHFKERISSLQEYLLLGSEIGEVGKIKGGNCSPSPQRSFAPGFACISVLLLCFFLSTQQDFELKKKTFY